MNTEIVFADGVVKTAELAPWRTVDGRPSDIRWARKPSGEMELQAAYCWRTENTGGIEWRAVEVVDVPESTQKGSAA